MSISFDPSQDGVAAVFDPNKNGLTNALTNLFDPNKNAFVTKFSIDSNIDSFIKSTNNNNTFKNLNTNNWNGFVTQITNDLSPQNVKITITKSINPKIKLKKLLMIQLYTKY